MLAKKGNGWGNVKDLINRGIVASNKGEEKTQEFADIVKGIQRIAALYGDEMFSTIPAPARQHTRDLFGLDKDDEAEKEEEVKAVTKKEPVTKENKANKIVLKLIRKYYRKRTTKLVYEEKTEKPSLSTTRVRQRLCDLMGTDVIRLNDKRYFQKLTERLQEEYETIMDKQEDARAASEEERLRRLMLEGVIDAPNDHRAMVYGHDKKQNKKKKRRKSKRPSSSKVTYETKISDDEGQSKTRKEEVITQIEMLSDSRGTQSKSPTGSATRKSSMKKVHIDERDEGHTLNEMHARPPHHESALRPSSSCSSHRKSRRVKSAAPRISHWEKEPVSSDDESSATTNDFDTQSLPERHYIRKPSKYSTNEPERVSRLRMEETVAGLYSIAEELVSPMGPEDQTTRKVNLPKPKKKMTMSSLNK